MRRPRRRSIPVRGADIHRPADNHPEEADTRREGGKHREAVDIHLGEAVDSRLVEVADNRLVEVADNRRAPGTHPAMVEVDTRPPAGAVDSPLVVGNRPAVVADSSPAEGAVDRSLTLPGYALTAEVVAVAG